MKGQKFSAYVKQTYGGGRDFSVPTCYKCGKKGHMQRQCPGENNRGNKKRGPPPGVCPRRQKGKHWKKKM